MDKKIQIKLLLNQISKILKCITIWKVIQILQIKKDYFQI